jgi:hypothetical protein
VLSTLAFVKATPYVLTFGKRKTEPLLRSIIPLKLKLRWFTLFVTLLAVSVHVPAWFPDKPPEFPLPDVTKTELLRRSAELFTKFRTSSVAFRTSNSPLVMRSVEFDSSRDTSRVTFVLTTTHEPLVGSKPVDQIAGLVHDPPETVVNV